MIAPRKGAIKKNILAAYNSYKGIGRFRGHVLQKLSQSVLMKSTEKVLTINWRLKNTSYLLKLRVGGYLAGWGGFVSKNILLF